jgi:hypothetical protein
VYPVFADAFSDQPPSPLATTSFISIGPASKPLFQPRPFTGPGSQCDPRLASTGHSAIQIGVLDGSVRSLASSISGELWWSAVTPSGGEAMGADW